jgi:hypothetical protein
MLKTETKAKIWQYEFESDFFVNCTDFMKTTAFEHTEPNQYLSVMKQKFSDNPMLQPFDTQTITEEAELERTYHHY